MQTELSNLTMRVKFKRKHEHLYSSNVSAWSLHQQSNHWGSGQGVCLPHRLISLRSPSSLCGAKDMLGQAAKRCKCNHGSIPNSRVALGKNFLELWFSIYNSISDYSFSSRYVNATVFLTSPPWQSQAPQSDKKLICDPNQELGSLPSFLTHPPEPARVPDITLSSDVQLITRFC